MLIEPVTLDGQHARLEPMSLAHVPALWRAGAHEEIWRYLPYAMRSEEDMRGYVASELAKQAAGLVVRFVTVAKASAQAIGSRIRHSVYFSIIHDEWPRVKAHLEELLAAYSTTVAARPSSPGEREKG